MKKLLGSVLALALLAGVSQANAELLKNFKFGGSVEMDAVSARQRDWTSTREHDSVPTDHVGTAQTRIMLNMDWDLLDDVHSKVSMYKNDQVYGKDVAGPNGARTQSAVLSQTRRTSRSTRCSAPLTRPSAASSTAKTATSSPPGARR